MIKCLANTYQLRTFVSFIEWAWFSQDMVKMCESNIIILYY